MSRFPRESKTVNVALKRHYHSTPLEVNAIKTHKLDAEFIPYVQPLLCRHIDTPGR